ncbi:hypothetical protein COEREDRAFT_85161 [Coemansia reversa NRRL 1564]|uniref:BHLH domain-containing protein n=1 Tax=Coemansia reversa (strain ATCC 12441 / NRRL 1564) TaxID=763665 RepID=A0A2G5BIX9_COERN|nr:hypothetical protein COEREDRAFT_85161 [Coemansia reversa NRRL 1564]|eukprot:PIA18707.1 hypothetical protein COEREDRAFT_85161 [Coemansia reversa NRRL 1564]
MFHIAGNSSTPHMDRGMANQVPRSQAQPLAIPSPGAYRQHQQVEPPLAEPRMGAQSAVPVAHQAMHGGHYIHSDYYYHTRAHPYATPQSAPARPEHSPRYSGYSPHLADGGRAATGRDDHYRMSIGSNAEERERKRRVSHSAMERRRRERTNNIINELRGLIPWLHEETRMQKLEVLEACARYIKQLQHPGNGRAGVHRPEIPQNNRGDLTRCSDDHVSSTGEVCCEDNASQLSDDAGSSPRLSQSPPRQCACSRRTCCHATAPATTAVNPGAHAPPTPSSLHTAAGDGAHSRHSSSPASATLLGHSTHKELVVSSCPPRPASYAHEPQPPAKSSIDFLTM